MAEGDVVWMLWFQNDYSIGAHPKVLSRITAINACESAGYGLDIFSQNAANRIREKAKQPRAQVYFLSGGTQTNLIAISTLLRPWEAVISAETGHINTHETGAIEATGHKVLTRQSPVGKLTPEMIEDILSEHDSPHMVKPAMAYISHPTEVGTLYTRKELDALYAFCRSRGLYLYLDGARLASALDAGDADLPFIAEHTDLFSVGGTKCGALFGEALVVRDPALAPDMLYSIKTRGGRFAKGFVIGAQFEALMEDGLYEEIGRLENDSARILREGLLAGGVSFAPYSTTNQLFPVLSEEKIASLSKIATFEKMGRGSIRLVTSWATPKEDCEAFLRAVFS